MSTPRLGLQGLGAAQSQPEIPINSDERIIDTVAPNISALAIQNAPPGGTPSDGDTYIVGTSGTGAFFGRNNEIAYWVNPSSTWRFIGAREGWLAYVKGGTPKFYYWTGTTWTVTGLI